MCVSPVNDLAIYIENEVNRHEYEDIPVERPAMITLFGWPMRSF